MIGVQASGKSSFCRERLFDTHVRINLDMLKTRHRERELLAACLAIGQSFAVDKMNLTRADRARYIAPARKAGFEVAGYYFRSRIGDALARNAGRRAGQRVPEGAVKASHAGLELPSRDEGFDRLHYVAIRGGEFVVEEWRDDL